MALCGELNIKQIAVIEEYVDYFEKCASDLNALKRGETRLVNFDLPPKPKEHLMEVLGLKKEKQINDLNEFLKQKLILGNDVDRKQLADEIKNMRQMKNMNEVNLLLKNTVTAIKNSQTIHHSLVLGCCLEIAFQYVKKERQNWKDFLKLNNLTQTQTCMLRELAKLFFNFPLFHRLCISVKQLYKIRKAIVDEFAKNELFKLYWQSSNLFLPKLIM